MNKNNNILSKLDGLRSIVKQAKTGGDLYISFKNYRNFVLDNWPENMPDRQGWKREMEFTLEKLESKKSIKNINQSKDLQSFITDASNVMHHYDGEFSVYLSKSEDN